MKRFLLTWTIITITRTVTSISDSTVIDPYGRSNYYTQLKYKCDTTSQLNIKYFLSRDSAYDMYDKLQQLKSQDSADVAVLPRCQRIKTILIDSIP